MKSYLGVDIGTSSVKIVELALETYGPKLLTYGLIELENNIVRDTSDAMKKIVSSAIRDIIQKAKAKSKLAVASLPGFSVFTSLINLPKMNDKELAQAIKYEARRYVPISLENMVLDWKVLKQRELSTKEGLGTTNMEILLTAAPKTLVNRYVEIFKMTGLKLQGLETEAFALTRSLVGNDRSPVMIVDMGSSATDIIVVKEGFPVLNRTIGTAGKAITSSISQSLNVNVDRAEQFKRDAGVKSNGQQVPPAIDSVMKEILKEIQNTLKLYHGKNEKSIEKVIISGGSASLIGVDKYIFDEIGIKVYRGNPWARVSYPEALGDILGKIGAVFSVAVGLAMREAK